MLGQVFREWDPKMQSSLSLDAGKHDIGPVGDAPPAVHKQALHTTPLQLVTCSGAVAQQRKLHSLHLEVLSVIFVCLQGSWLGDSSNKIKGGGLKGENLRLNAIVAMP